MEPVKPAGPVPEQMRPNIYGGAAEPGNHASQLRDEVAATRSNASGARCFDFPTTLLAFKSKNVALYKMQAVVAKDDTASAACAAACTGNVEKLKQIVSGEGKANVGDYDSRTPLHLAAAGGHLECVRFLVEECGAVPQMDRFMSLPVHDAAMEDNVMVVSYFKQLDKPLQDALAKSRSSRQPSKDATTETSKCFGVSELQRWNCRAKFSTEQQEITAKLCAFAEKGDTENILKMVQEQKADINASDYDGRTPLHLAAAGGKLDTVKAISEVLGAMPQRDRWASLPLQDAMRNGDPSTVEYMIALQRKRDQLGAPPKVQALMDQVSSYIVDEGIFSLAVAYREAEQWMTELGWSPCYFDRFAPMQIADHLLSFMSAKRHAQVNGNSDVDAGDCVYSVDHTMDDNNCGYFITSGVKRKLLLRAEQKASDLIAGCPQGLGVCVNGYTSKGTIATGARVTLIHFNRALPFAKAVGALGDSDEAFLESVATNDLLNDLSQDQRKTGLVRRCSNQPSPAIESKESPNGFQLVIGAKHKPPANALVELSQVLHALKLELSHYRIYSFANGVMTYEFNFHEATSRDVRAALGGLVSAFNVKPSPLHELFTRDVINAEMLLYLHCAGKFVFYFVEKESPDYHFLVDILKNDPIAKQKLDQLYLQAMTEVITEEKIFDVFRGYPEIVKLAYDDFFNITLGGKKPAFNEELQAAAFSATRDDVERNIFRALVTFNAHIRATNFFKGANLRTDQSERAYGSKADYSTEGTNAAVAFRLDPIFLKAHHNMFPEVPYGIYLIVGREFYGFHVRFRDVARGGIRLVRSRDAATHKINASRLFEENYGLAFTQQLKNKDIPEGGSKGTILLEVSAQSQGQECFTKYLDALLDIMLLDFPGIVSHLDQPEILVFGPDEGTADFMDMGAMAAKARGYKYWKSITTGKSMAIGGIPHDAYGMTTRSVHQVKLSLLETLGVKEETITKMQTGGPDGDLGSNEVLISKDRTLGLVDGSGVVYDPEGLNRSELVKLARKRITVNNFDRSKLSATGFLIEVSQKNVRLPDGSIVEDGTSFRDRFHLSKYFTADLFVPCGGRPKAVTLQNVEQLFEDGRCKFKYVVEGANLFFTDDARRLLEHRGVHIIKDAAANKGGVTSSSCEVLAGLAMTVDEHAQTLCVAKGQPAPPMYNEYALQISAIIEENARLEFKAMWRENQRGILKTDSTVLLSKKINSIADFVSASLSLENEKDLPLIRTVLRRAVPAVLLNKVGLDGLINNVPNNYLKAIISAWIGSKYVYEFGLTANEHCYFLFMRELASASDSSESTVPPCYVFPDACAALARKKNAPKCKTLNTSAAGDARHQRCSRCRDPTPPLDKRTSPPLGMACHAGSDSECGARA
jgi:glutamate dehydrogenase